MSSVAGMGLSADDRLDILELPGRYAEALDTLQPDQLSAVFTDDAVWEVEGGRIRLEGLAAIEEFMGRPDVHPGAHIMANPFISGVDEVDGASVVRLKTRGIYPVGPDRRGFRHRSQSQHRRPNLADRRWHARWYHRECHRR